MANPEDLGRYRLKRLLGRGALGEVWEARDAEQEGSKVAVKIMHAADDELAFARSAFAREARLASLMRHPNVAAVHDAGEAAGTSFLVMDMVEGKSLRSLMSDASITATDKLRWLRQIGDGLAAMHRAGVVHRDLKPENVIVRPDRTACLVDLGIAKWAKFTLGSLDENDLEMAQSSMPRSEYAPPETTEQQLYDELGDQYAWGLIAYELLTGSVPAEGSPPLADRDDVPHRAAVALDRARSRRRDDRWEAMEDALGELILPDASEPPSQDGPDLEGGAAEGDEGRGAGREEERHDDGVEDDRASGSAPPAEPTPPPEELVSLAARWGLSPGRVLLALLLAAALVGLIALLR